MSIQQTLDNTKYWQRLQQADYKETLFSSFTRGHAKHPVKLRLNQTKFMRTTNTANDWIFIFRVEKTISTEFIALFENAEMTQFAVVCDVPVKRPSFYETKILKVYKSNYIRKSKRHIAEGNGFKLKSIRVKNDNFNPEEMKATIEILFKSYSRLLSKSFNDYEISRFPGHSTDELDDILNQVKSHQCAVWLADTALADSYNFEAQIQYDKDTISFEKYNVLSESDIFKMMPKYQRLAIRNELILPINFQRQGNVTESLGYIRIRNIDENKLSFEQAVHGVHQTSHAIVTALTSSNFAELPGSFDIVDISMGGICIMLQDELLLKQLLDMKRFRANIKIPDSDVAIISQCKTIHAQKGKFGFYLGLKLLDINLADHGADDSESAWAAVRKSMRNLDIKI